MENDLYFVFTQKKQTNSIRTDFHGWQNQNSVDWKRLHSALFTHTHSEKGGQFVESDVWTRVVSMYHHRLYRTNLTNSPLHRWSLKIQKSLHCYHSHWFTREREWKHRERERERMWGRPKEEMKKKLKTTKFDCVFFLNGLFTLSVCVCRKT